MVMFIIISTHIKVCVSRLDKTFTSSFGRSTSYRCVHMQRAIN